MCLHGVFGAHLGPPESRSSGRSAEVTLSSPARLSYLTGFGLAAGAGAKAGIPVLVLGAFHYTPYFELSSRWTWIAAPPVMAVLGLLVFVELWLDAHPDLGAYSDLAGYAPKLAAGFLAFAAATGELDPNLVELAGSGFLGSMTAGGVHWLRNRIRRPIREHAEEVHTGVGKAVSFGEAGIATAVSGGAILAPALALCLLGFGIAGALLVARAIGEETADCPGCGGLVHPKAVVCRHCHEAIGGT